MKVFILDQDSGVGIDLAVRAEDAGHDIRYFTKSEWHGKGMFERVSEWEPSMDWADLIVMTGNSKYSAALAPYFEKDYPIFGTNAKAAELELDREAGQRALKEAGILTLPYKAVDSIDAAIDYIRKERMAYAIKPWGGETDKAMTCVPEDADEAIFILNKWKSEKKKGKLMLQEKVDGIEMGISGFFGAGGWSKVIEESFEHKKFFNEDLGCNTGEQGTVIKHVRKSELFDKVLEPLTDMLHELGFVGDCNVNCIIDESGDPWPLEFTIRLGWPDFCIRQALIESDPVEWMLGLVNGEDLLKVSDKVATGVVLTHGDYPQEADSKDTWVGFPINGVSAANMDSLHLQDVMEGDYITMKGKKRGLLTAGCYIAVVTGTGDTVSAASRAAYKVAWQVRLPSNLMFRTDIGERLRRDLPRLHKLGYAKEIDY